MSRSDEPERGERSPERAPPYWAALAAAFVVTAAPAFAQSPSAADPAPEPSEKQSVVLLEADIVGSDQARNTVTARGDVQLRYGERTLRADQVVYHTDTGQVVASGNVQVVGDDGSATFAEEVLADTELNIGVARELRARLEPSGTLVARSAISAGEGRNELRKVVYTSCPLCEDGSRPPTWSIRARRASQNQEARIISYQGAVLEVVGAPVLYLPYFAHPDPSAERSSGLLTPDFGSNRRVGAFYEQPYYWAISPHQDATVSLRAHGNVNPLLGVEYRKRFYSGDLRINGTITQAQEFDGTGNLFGDETTRSSLFAQGRFQVNDYWTWGFGAERISDDLYLRRYGLDGYGQVRGPYVGDYTRLISQLYMVGQDERSYSSITAVNIQSLRPEDTAAVLPTILPYIDVDRVYTDPLLGGQLRLQGNAAALTRSVGYDSARASAGVTWRRDVVFGPGLVASPFAQARSDVYHVQTSADDEETFSRSLGIAGAELSWPLMRVGQGLDVVLEPVVMAAYASEGEDTRIVNEDSIGFELDDSNLFRPNAASNYDLWEPGGRVSAGVRATVQTHAGQSARVFLGRRWRDEVAPQFTVQNNMEGRASDWVGSVETDLGEHFGGQMRFRLDDETLELQRLDADVRASVGRFTARARYFQVDETLSPDNPTEEVAGAVAVRLAAGWSAQFGLRRDLDSNTNISQDIRAIYQDDCTFLEITYTRSETQIGALGPDEGFRIRIGLTSLGMVGNR